MIQIFVLVLLALILIPSEALAQSAADITTSVQKIGSPFSSKPIYGRNVWDIKVFDNKLYFAHGDAVYNAGPISVIAYNSTGSDFVNEYTSQDEQINKLEIIDNQLVFAGGDSCCGTGDIPGSFYRKEATGWQKYKNIPNALHVFDIYKFSNKLFAGTGSNTSNTQIFISSDNGANWTKALMDLSNLNFTVDINYAPYARFYDFFVFKNELYANGVYISADGSGVYPNIAKFNGTNSFVFLPPIVDSLYPGIADNNKYMYRPTVFQNQVFYSVIKFSLDDQMIPYAFYKTSDMTNGVKISLPNNAVVRDIKLESDGNLYVLAAYKSGTQYINSVFQSSDGVTFIELFKFSNPTFARSFALYNNGYYFGLGCTNTNAASNCGDILKYQPVAASPSVSAKIGDIDGNGKVDIFDYNQLLTDYGKRNDSNTKADLDNDDDVDIFDYNILLTNFGK